MPFLECARRFGISWDSEQLVYYLEAGLVMSSRQFNGFRAAFDPSEIMWDHESKPFWDFAQGIARGGSIAHKTRPFVSRRHSGFWRYS